MSWIGGASVAFDPLLPWAVLAPLLALAALACIPGLARRARGAAWRGAVGLVLALALLNPSLVQEQRDPVDDVAVVVVDRSPSQAVPGRAQRTDEALAALRNALADDPDLEVRTVEIGAAGGPDGTGGGAGDGAGEATAGASTVEETRLFQALDDAVADVPRGRLAGAILLTDGQVHDVPADPARLAELGPVHTLLTGERDEADRRLTVVETPAYGLVGRPVTVTLRVDDLPGGGGGTVTVLARQDGGSAQRIDLPVGADTPVTFDLSHGGANVLEFEVAPAEQELSPANNRAAVVVNGVRDRLRVLLVSGEPHPGERTWRDILKSDPNIDLVHFTILRPPDKQDGTPINELSLISFPIRELFEMRLYDFDLIVFDRYRRRGVLPNLYLDNIAQYVANGGAFLEASGPPFATMLSLYYTPLGSVLPGEPTGALLEEPFRPALTELGRRHPVTAGLEGAGPEGGTPSWGRWFRQVEVEPTRGTAVMSGAEGRPLMLLDRVGEGRVAQILSDQFWLWSRGYEGGGPQAELLRRLAHWLMKEPELEEENLTATVAGRRIAVERRSLSEAAASIKVTTPSGGTREVALADAAPGTATAVIQADEPGLFRLTDGTHVALAVVGALNPPELADMRATPDRLAPVAEATGGTVRWLVDGVPAIRRTAPDRAAEGDGWIGLRANGAYTVTGVREVPLLPAAALLVLVLGPLLAAWRREGR